jgi:Pvc16 N-terminal domain/Carboxypeptidase regulatory-like domain
MIADLDDTIEKLLIQEMPIKNGEVEVKFDQPKREWSSRLSRPTVNLFLYDLRENVALRQHQWEQAGNGRRSDNIYQLKRSPFRVDCFYMITTWASDPLDEHRLLTRTLLALFRFPVLPAEMLLGGLQSQPFEIQARLASHDRLTNPAEVWGSLDNEMRPSISYLVTLALDPWSEVTGPLVRTRILRTGLAGALPRLHSRLEPGAASELVAFSGTVWEKGKQGVPRAGIEVAVKGTGLFTKTDEDGRYQLGSLPPGDYTLLAWPEKGKPLEKAINLPPGDGDYDFQL